MPRFTSPISNNIVARSSISTTTVGTLCSCVFSAVGSYSFTVPCYKSPNAALGWPGLFVCVVGGGGGGASGTNCGCGNATFSPGYSGSTGNSSCFGNVVAFGGGGGQLFCPTAGSCAGTSDWSINCLCCSLLASGEVGVIYCVPYYCAGINGAACAGSICAECICQHPYTFGASRDTGGIIASSSIACCWSYCQTVVYCYNTSTFTTYSCTGAQICFLGYGANTGYYFCAYAVSAPPTRRTCSGNGGCGGNGGIPGIGIGTVIGCNIFGANTSCGCLCNPLTLMIGAYGGKGGCICYSYARGNLTPGSSVSVCVGDGGDGGTGWPAINTCVKNCCCCTPPGQSCGLWAFGYWPTLYTAGGGGAPGVVCVCWYQ